MLWIEKTLDELKEEINESTDAAEKAALTKKYDTINRNKSFWETVETKGIASTETLQAIYDDNDLTYDRLYHEMESHLKHLDTEYNYTEYDSDKYTLNRLAADIKLHENLMEQLEELVYDD